MPKSLGISSNPRQFLEGVKTQSLSCAGALHLALLGLQVLAECHAMLLNEGIACFEEPVCGKPKQLAEMTVVRGLLVVIGLVLSRQLDDEGSARVKDEETAVIRRDRS